MTSTPAVSSDEMERRLREVLSTKGNKTCADCPAEKPLWASYLRWRKDEDGKEGMGDSPKNDGKGDTSTSDDDVKDVDVEGYLGVLLCKVCAEHHHYELGKKRCMLKYIKYSHELTPENIDILEHSGNSMVNKYYEASLTKDDFDKEHIHDKRQEESKRRAKFVKNKYKKVKYRAHAALAKAIAKIQRKRQPPEEATTQAPKGMQPEEEPSETPMDEVSKHTMDEEGAKERENPPHESNSGIIRRCHTTDTADQKCKRERAPLTAVARRQRALASSGNPQSRSRSGSRRAARRRSSFSDMNDLKRIPDSMDPEKLNALTELMRGSKRSSAAGTQFEPTGKEIKHSRSSKQQSAQRRRSSFGDTPASIYLGDFGNKGDDARVRHTALEGLPNDMPGILPTKLSCSKSGDANQFRRGGGRRAQRRRSSFGDTPKSIDFGPRGSNTKMVSKAPKIDSGGSLGGDKDNKPSSSDKNKSHPKKPKALRRHSSLGDLTNISKKINVGDLGGLISQMNQVKTLLQGSAKAATKLKMPEKFVSPIHRRSSFSDVSSLQQNISASIVAVQMRGEIPGTKFSQGRPGEVSQTKSPIQNANTRTSCAIGGGKGAQRRRSSFGDVLGCTKYGAFWSRAMPKIDSSSGGGDKDNNLHGSVNSKSHSKRPKSQRRRSSFGDLPSLRKNRNVEGPDYPAQIMKQAKTLLQKSTEVATTRKEEAVNVDSKKARRRRRDDGNRSRSKDSDLRGTSSKDRSKSPRRADTDSVLRGSPSEKDQKNRSRSKDSDLRGTSSKDRSKSPRRADTDSVLPGSFSDKDHKSRSRSKDSDPRGASSKDRSKSPKRDKPRGSSRRHYIRSMSPKRDSRGRRGTSSRSKSPKSDDVEWQRSSHHNRSRSPKRDDAKGRGSSSRDCSRSKTNDSSVVHGIPLRDDSHLGGSSRKRDSGTALIDLPANLALDRSRSSDGKNKAKDSRSRSSSRNRSRAKKQDSSARSSNRSRSSSRSRSRKKEPGDGSSSNLRIRSGSKTKDEKHPGSSSRHRSRSQSRRLPGCGQPS